jgi:ABC-type nitrate/sulfonate/bicarbonate transport system substrate-binding protein
MKTGDCDAAMVAQPLDIQLKKQGFNVVGSSHDVIPQLQYTVYAARRAWAEKNKDVVVRFARAIGESYKYIANPANKDDVIAMAVQMTGQPKEIITELYKTDYEPYNGVLPEHGEIDLAGLNKVSELMKRSGAIDKVWPVEKFADIQYLKAAGMQ